MISDLSEIQHCKNLLLLNKPKEEQDLSWREVAVLLPPR